MSVSSEQLPENGSVQVRVKVTNTGSVAGKEVVQLYTQDPVASVVRPVQQLVDFRKISLEPGESQWVEFTVTEQMLRFWNMLDQHITEPGEIRFMVGYADHFQLTCSIRRV